MAPSQDEIDARIQSYYGDIFDEHARLTTRSAQGPLEHFHTAEEIHSEVEAAGLDVLDVVGVEGPAGLFLEVVGDADQAVQDAALVVARAASGERGIRDQSAHLLAIARVR